MRKKMKCITFFAFLRILAGTFIFICLFGDLSLYRTACVGVFLYSSSSSLARFWEEWDHHCFNPQAVGRPGRRTGSELWERKRREAIDWCIYSTPLIYYVT